MGIAISEDHLELAGVADAFLERTGARAEARSLLDAPEETLPGAWKEMADLGWLGLHLPEAHGGSGLRVRRAGDRGRGVGRRRSRPGPSSRRSGRRR